MKHQKGFCNSETFTHQDCPEARYLDQKNLNERVPQYGSDNIPRTRTVLIFCHLFRHLVIFDPLRSWMTEDH